MLFVLVVVVVSSVVVPGAVVASDAAPGSAGVAEGEVGSFADGGLDVDGDGMLVPGGICMPGVIVVSDGGMVVEAGGWASAIGASSSATGARNRVRMDRLLSYVID